MRLGHTYQIAFFWCLTLLAAIMVGCSDSEKGGTAKATAKKESTKKENSKSESGQAKPATSSGPKVSRGAVTKGSGATTSTTNDNSTESSEPTTESPSGSLPPNPNAALNNGEEPKSNLSDPSTQTQGSTPTKSDEPVKKPGRLMAPLIKNPNAKFLGEPMEIDWEKVKSAGLERVEGKHIVLVSDYRDPAVLRELTQVFDAAMPEWCRVFEIPKEKVENWKINAFLIKEAAKLKQGGVLPDDLPEFANGYYRGYEFWFYDQPSDYYRRFLMLHEGTHAFMHHFLGGAGPPWYLEGMAEYIATHQWKDGNLTLRYALKNKEEAPYWGRIRIVQDAFKHKQGKYLEEVFSTPMPSFLVNDAYGWSWAACNFLDNHPLTQKQFREKLADVGDRSGDFSTKLIESIGSDWPKVSEEWQVYISEIDFGYDFTKGAVTHKAARDFLPQGESVIVQANEGWQSTGIRVNQGGTYLITADGRFTVRNDDEKWECEAEGITIDYYRGIPLGRLVGAIRAENSDSGQTSGLMSPFSIGRKQQVRAEASGILYLRINENPGKLSDNDGKLQVHIAPGS